MFKTVDSSNYFAVPSILLAISSFTVIFSFNILLTRLIAEEAPYTISIEELESKGLRDHKYVRITNAFVAGAYITHEKRGDIDGKYMVFPIISQEELENNNEYIASNGYKIKVLIKRSNGSVATFTKHNKLDSASRIIEGFGGSELLASIDYDDKSMMESFSNTTLDKNYILIKEGKQVSYLRALLPFIIAGLMALLAIIAFYTQASIYDILTGRAHLFRKIFSKAP